MKTEVVTLQGYELVASHAASQALATHLKAVKNATRFHTRAYRENAEALRDILIEQNVKIISKPIMTKAISLVGVPDNLTVIDAFRTRLPRLYSVLARAYRRSKKITSKVGKQWQKPVVIVISIVALFMSISYGFLALTLLQSSNQSSGSWNTIETTIGRVRSYTEAYPAIEDSWLFGWQIHVLYAVLFLVIAIAVLHLIRPKRLPVILTLFACSFVLLAFWQAQRQTIETRVSVKTSYIANTQPLTGRLAYLQQCGDEIPYVFNNETSGMLFRQLRDDGFTLAVEIPGAQLAPDINALCVEYDKLRKNHPTANIVLQLYTKETDGTLRPYMYSDLEKNQSVYGFFVKQ